MMMQTMATNQHFIDDILIRKDGLFVVDELKDLNPENLI